MEVGFDVWAWPLALLGQGAAVALVAAAGLVAWQLSFVLLLACLIIFLGIVANLDKSRRQFATAFWILICGQVFALGTLLSVNALAADQEAWPRTDEELLPGLPSAAEVQEWAVSLNESLASSYVFQGTLLFNSRIDGVEGLMAADLSANLSDPAFEPSAVGAGQLTAARGFTEFEGRLFFAAETSSGDELWFGDSAMVWNASVQRVQGADSRMKLRSFLVHDASLYVKVSWYACGAWMPGLLRLQNDTLASVIGQTSCFRPSQGSLLGELFLAMLPVALLATWLMRSLPGLCVALFFSLFGAIVVIRLLADPELEELEDFIFTAFTAYSSAAYVLVMLLHFLGRNGAWHEDLKSWSTVLVAVSFCAAVQMRLDVPATPEVWRWIVFALCGFVLQLLGAVARRRLPVLLGYFVLLLSSAKLMLQLLDLFTALRSTGLAAQRALQLGALAALGGIVPSPDLVPMLPARPSHAIAPAPEEQKEKEKEEEEAAPEAMPPQMSEAERTQAAVVIAKMQGDSSPVGKFASAAKALQVRLAGDDLDAYAKTNSILKNRLQANGNEDAEAAQDAPAGDSAMLELEEESAAASEQEEV